MIKYFLNKIHNPVMYELSESEVKEAELLAATKYKSWEWNFAYGPEYSFRNSFKLDGETYSCFFFVKDGIIRECSIKVGSRKVSASEKLIGCRHMKQDLLTVRKDQDNG
jgi:lipoate-protein ligase A